MNEVDFHHQVVVVTGAGRGLGRGYALEFARRGASIVVNDFGGGLDGEGASHTPAEQVVREIIAAGGTAVASTDSVATPDGGNAIVHTALEHFGRIDALVNNAGILRDRSLAKLTDQDIEPVLDVHLRGAFNVTVPAYRVMREQGYGRIVMTTSAAGLFGNFGQANYSAAKMGLVGLANTIAIEGHSHNVLCNVVSPMAASRMTAEVMGEASLLVDPELVTPMVTYLASSHCDLTHEIFSVGGGRFARVFIGVGPGWFAGQGSRPAAEDVLEHIEDIRSSNSFTIPLDAKEESELLLPHLQGTAVPTGSTAGGVRG